MIHRRLRLLVVLIVLGALVGVPATQHISRAAAQPLTAAATTNALKFAGSIGGALDAVSVNGSLAYIGEGASLSILDISDPAQPVRRAYVPLPQNPRDIHAAGSLVLVALGADGLQIIDVSNPDQPVLRRSYRTSGSVQQVQVSGSRAYLIEEQDAGKLSLHVLDVSNPDTPIFRGSYKGLEDAEELQVVGSLAYISSSARQGLLIIDVSNPDLPTLRGSFRTSGEPVDLAVVGQRAYLIDQSGINANTLRILDVSNPAAPSLLGSYSQTPLSVASISVSGTTVYIAQHQSQELLIVDAGNPATPVLSGSYTAGALVNTVTATTNTLSLATANGLELVDASKADNPVRRGTYVSGERISRIQVVDKLVYAVAKDSGLLIYDVSDPAQPRLHGSFDQLNLDFAEQVEDVRVQGDRAYLVTSNSLRILDVSNPTQPTQLGAYEDVALIRVEVVGTLAYVLSLSKLVILDVSNPANPTLRTDYQLPNAPASDMELVGNLVYVPVECFFCDAWLYIIDVSDPSHPVDHGSTNVPQVHNVTVRGNLAYVAGYPVEIIDVSDPDVPTPLNSYRTPGEAEDLEIFGARAYIADGTAGVHVAELTTADAPHSLGSYPLAGIADDIEVSGGLVFSANQSSGLFILRIQTPVFLPLVSG